MRASAMQDSWPRPHGARVHGPRWRSERSPSPWARRDGVRRDVRRGSVGGKSAERKKESGERVPRGEKERFMSTFNMIGSTPRRRLIVHRPWWHRPLRSFVSWLKDMSMLVIAMGFSVLAPSSWNERDRLEMSTGRAR